MTSKNYLSKIDSFNVSKNFNTLNYNKKNYANKIEGLTNGLNSLTINETVVGNVIDFVDEYVFSEDIDSNKYSFNTYYPEIKKDGFTTQGLTIYNGFKFLSAYGSGNSRLYIYDDNNNYIGFIRLNQSSHVGGVTFDETNKIMYVTNGGGNYSTYNMNEIQHIINNKANYTNGKLDILLHPVNTIDYYEFKNLIDANNTEGELDSILTKPLNEVYEDWRNNYNDEKYSELTRLAEQTHTLIIDNDLSAMCTASTTYFKDGLLYTCQFVGSAEGKMDIFKPIYTKKDNKPFITYEKVLEEPIPIPARTQGVAVTNYNGKEYIVFSRSTGPLKSTMSVWEKDSNGNYIYIGDRNYDLGGMEGIYIDENNQITACFENENETMSMSMETLLSELSNPNDPRSYITRFYEKLMGSGWDAGGIGAWSNFSSRAKKLFSWGSILDKPEQLVTTFFSIGEVTSILPVAFNNLIIPSFLKKNEYVNSSIEILNSFLGYSPKEVFSVWSKDIDNNGLLSGLFLGGAKSISHLFLNNSKNLFNGISILDEGIIRLYNAAFDKDIDTEQFNELRDWVSEHITDIKTKVDNGINEGYVYIDDGYKIIKEEFGELKSEVKKDFDTATTLAKMGWDATGGYVAKQFTSTGTWSKPANSPRNGPFKKLHSLGEEYKELHETGTDMIEDWANERQEDWEVGADMVKDWTNDRVDDVKDWGKDRLEDLEDLTDLLTF